MIGTWPADRPGDKTLADLLTARPHLATLNTVALAVREGAIQG